MTLQFVVESLEDVPEALRENYEEHDGKYRLKLDGAVADEEVSGLKSALEKEREARKELAKKAKQLPEGFDPEEWEALRKEKLEREEKRAKEAGEFEKLRASLREQHDKDLAKKDEKITALNRSLQTALIGGEATRAISKADGSVTLLLPHIERHAVLVEQDDGSHVVRIRDPKGDGYRMDGKGEYLTIAGLVSEMREQEEFGRAFAASGATGGGASGGKPAGGGKKDPSKMTESEKLDWYENTSLDDIAAAAAAGVKAG